MPRFSLKTLFLSMTLIAVGLGMFLIGFQVAETNTEFFLIAWILGPALFGAGLFAPFNHPYIGAAIFGIGIPVITFIMFVTAMSH